MSSGAERARPISTAESRSPHTFCWPLGQLDLARSRISAESWVESDGLDRRFMSQPRKAASLSRMGPASPTFGQPLITTRRIASVNRSAVGPLSQWPKSPTAFWSAAQEVTPSIALSASLQGLSAAAAGKIAAARRNAAALGRHARSLGRIALRKPFTDGLGDAGGIEAAIGQELSRVAMFDEVVG